MSRGSLWGRLVRGTRWTWLADRYREALPPDLAETVMGLQAGDRHHAKQGRSTARWVLHNAGRTLAVYLKRHYRLPWWQGLFATLWPAGFDPAKHGAVLVK